MYTKSTYSYLSLLHTMSQSAAPSLAMLLLLAMRSSSLCSRSLLLLLLFLQVTWGLESARKNVLLLVADDFRPNLGLYDEANRPMFNSPHMLTPHLDRQDTVCH